MPVQKKRIRTEQKHSTRHKGKNFSDKNKINPFLRLILQPKL